MEQEQTPNQKQQQLIQLAPGGLQLLEHVSNRHDADIAQGVDPKELLKPEFWAHQAVRLRPMDEIRARATDGTWVGYYLVLDTSRTWARVHLLSFHRLTTGQVAETQASELEVKKFLGAHEVKYRGALKWSLIRKGDGGVLEENIAEKEVAITRLEQIARTHVGAAPLRTPASAEA